MKAAMKVTLAICAVLLCVAPSVCRAQNLGPSGLDWHQRFLGILPLVKASPSDPVVANVNGTPITLAQTNSYAKTEARLINATSTAETNAVWQDALDSLINRSLLVQEAQRLDITVADPEVAQRAREYQLTGAEGRTESVPGAPDELLMREVRESMQIERMLDQRFKSHRKEPTEAEIGAYYNQHKDLFTSDPGEVRISHVAVKLPPNPSDEQKKAAEQKIKQLYQDAGKAKDFAQLARENSEDPNSAPKGGDLGYFRPGQLPPVVEKEAFATPVGNLSNIIASNIGYSFMKITEKRGATYQPLKDAKAKIALVLRDYKQDESVKELLRGLRKKAKIEIKQPAAAAT